MFLLLCLYMWAQLVYIAWQGADICMAMHFQSDLFVMSLYYTSKCLYSDGFLHFLPWMNFYFELSHNKPEPYQHTSLAPTESLKQIFQQLSCSSPVSLRAWVCIRVFVCVWARFLCECTQHKFRPFSQNVHHKVLWWEQRTQSQMNTAHKQKE